jgi:hypothetical protein
MHRSEKGKNKEQTCVGLYRLFLTGPVDDPSCHCSRGSLYTERQVRKEREASPAIQRFRLYRTIANAEEWQCSEWLAVTKRNKKICTLAAHSAIVVWLRLSYLEDGLSKSVIICVVISVPPYNSSSRYNFLGNLEFLLQTSILNSTTNCSMTVDLT